MCTEPALQSFNSFSSMGPPSVLGEITEHQHVPYRAGPNARQLLSPAPSPRRSWSSHLPRFFVAQPPRRSPSISLPPFGGAALPGGVLPEEAWEACLGSELLCDHAQRPELPGSLTGMAVRDRDGCSSEAEGSQPCQKDSSQGLFHVISICSTGRWPSLNSTSVRGRVGPPPSDLSALGLPPPADPGSDSGAEADSEEEVLHKAKTALKRQRGAGSRWNGRMRQQ